MSAAARSLLVLCVVPCWFNFEPVKAQSNEETFRRVTQLEIGNLRLSEISYESLAVDKVEVKDGVPTYTLRVVLRSADLELFASRDRQGQPLIAGKVTGTYLWKITSDPGNPQAIQKISGAPRSTTLVVNPKVAIPMTRLGSTATWASRSLEITSSVPFELSASSSSGSWTMAARGVTLKGVAISLGNMQAPVAIDFCTASGSQSTFSLDLVSGTVSRPVGSFASCLNKQSLPAAVTVKAETNVVSAPAYEIGRATLVSSSTGVRFTAKDVNFVNPAISIPARPPVDAIKTARLPEITVDLLLNGTSLVGSASSSSSPIVEPDQRKVVEKINDGYNVEDSLLPTGDPNARFISAHSLRKAYASLSEALNDKDSHHSILMVLNQDGTITSVEHSKVPGPEHYHYVCVSLGYAAKASIGGFAVATAIKNVLPFAFAGSLYAGAMLSPVVTPFVFAGITAVGIVGQIAAAEYFWGEVADATGIFAGLPGMKPEDVKNDLIQKGVEKLCEVAVQPLTSFPEPWPHFPSSSQQLLVLPAAKDGESIKLLIDRRRQFLMDGAKKWPRITPGKTTDIKSQIDCCDVRPVQNAFVQNSLIWSEFAAQRDRLLSVKQSEDVKRIQDQWAQQQHNNYLTSGELEMAYEQIRSASEQSLRQSIGGGTGQIIISFGPGGATINGSPVGGGSAGTGAGGAGNSGCGWCHCALHCIEMSTRR